MLVVLLAACAVDGGLACPADIQVEAIALDPHDGEPRRMPVDEGATLLAYGWGEGTLLELWTVARPQGADGCEVFLRLDPDPQGQAPFWATGHASFDAAEVEGLEGACLPTDDVSLLRVDAAEAHVEGPHVLQVTTSCPGQADHVTDLTVAVELADLPSPEAPEGGGA